MVTVVQLVRASDCGSECRGFESHQSPQQKLCKLNVCRVFFIINHPNSEHMKRLNHLLLLLCLLPLAMQAQEENKGISAQKERKFKLINPIDTNYIAPNQYNLVFRLEQSTWQENFKISSKSSDQSLKFAPDLSPKVGLYFGYRWLFLGYNFNLADKKKNEPKKTELSLNFYANKLGADLYYRKTGSDAKLRSHDGFDMQNTPSFEGSDFDGLSSKLFGANVSWIFNHKKYSQQASYRHNTVQLRNAGSFIANLSYTRHNISFDHGKLPTEMTDQLNPNLKFNHIKYSDYSLGFGYGYNWVLSKTWLASISLLPSISYKDSSIDGIDLKDESWTKNLNLDFITRGSIVYNTGKYFAGAMLVFNAYNNRKSDLCVNHSFGTLRIYSGLNFWKKKKYRNSNE